LAIAGHMLETGPDDLELQAGLIHVKGAPGRGLALAQLARQAYHRPETLPPGMAPADLELTVNYDADPGTGTFANATHLAVVEVSPTTGRVEILRYLVVEDCGVMINPLIIDGQVQGGTAQGIGGALYEHLVYDDQGQLLTTTFMDYLLPAATEVPPIEVFHRETPSPFTIGGFKGMGEGGAIAPGPCLANAVSDALAPLGATSHELPLTPERVLGAIRSAHLSARI
jgi:carbon-monoxide dehydrogenase large subunit